MYNIGVIYGSRTCEHDVSIISALQAAQALNKQKYTVTYIYIGREGNWYTGEALADIKFYERFDPAKVTRVIPAGENDKLVLYHLPEKKKLFGGAGAERVATLDVVMPVLHGLNGEDGTLQSLLEFLDIPFVGSSASVCQRAWNKDSLHYELAAYRNITGEEPVASWPQGLYIARDAFKSMGAATALDMVQDRVIGGYPVAVKPAHGGSAMGVHRVDRVEDLGDAVLDALSYDAAVVIEQWIEGVEMGVSILGTGWDAYALPPVEIVPVQGLYDTAARMTAGAVNMHCPVRPESLSPDPAQAQAIRAEIERAALEVYRAYNVRDMGRVDLIWDGAQARVLEMDVSPGMTEYSMFPAACKGAGLSLPKVMDELVNAALQHPPVW